MSIQHRFDFGWVHIKSAVDDQIFRAPDDEEVSIFQASEIASIKPSVGIDGSGGFFRSAIVALHDVGAANAQFADSPCGNRLAIASDELDLNSWKHRAN